MKQLGRNPIHMTSKWVKWLKKPDGFMVLPLLTSKLWDFGYTCSDWNLVNGVYIKSYYVVCSTYQLRQKIASLQITVVQNARSVIGIRNGMIWMILLKKTLYDVPQSCCKSWEAVNNVNWFLIKSSTSEIGNSYYVIDDHDFGVDYHLFLHFKPLHCAGVPQGNSLGPLKIHSHSMLMLLA